MSKSDFTSTVTLSFIDAVLFDRNSKEAVTREYVRVGNLDVETAEKAVEKAVKLTPYRLAYVSNVSVKTVHCNLACDLFMREAREMDRRGENGRTREPVITRTVCSTRVDVVLFNRTTREQECSYWIIPEAVTAEEAEKYIEKKLKNSAKRLAFVETLSVKEKVYEMNVLHFYGLCVKHGTVEEVASV